MYEKMSSRYFPAIAVDTTCNFCLVFNSGIRKFIASANTKDYINSLFTLQLIKLKMNLSYLYIKNDA